MTFYAAPLTRMRRQQTLAQGNARDVARWLPEQRAATLLQLKAGRRRFDAAHGGICALDAATDDTISDLLMGAAKFLRGSQ
jgi:hypothetical protein